MTGLFSSLLAISALLFPIASMLGVGLSYTLGELAPPLRQPDRVFRALVANFVLVPLLAFGISRLLSLDASLTAGLMLVGTAAGAPFLIKLTAAANADIALSAALLVLLLPITVVYMPVVVPLVVPDVTVTMAKIAAPLILTLLLPLAAGLVIRFLLPRAAKRLQPFLGMASTLALVALVASTVVVNARVFGGLFRSGIGFAAVAAAVLLVAGGFGAGFLLSSSGFNRRTVMGLGAGQRNIAAALVVASQDFDDPKTLVMVVHFSLIDRMVLFPIAF
jgi:BASS family bile acid:Na+ symporter